MTLGIGTSSPVVSVALFSGGEVFVDLSREAAGAASGAVAAMAVAALRSALITWDDVTDVVVDIGPGGFTGVKVGVTFAKTLAWAKGLRLSTVTSFDLICKDGTVVIPSKRGEWYVRVPGQKPGIVRGEPPEGSLGYGPGILSPVTPNLASIARNGLVCAETDAVQAVPFYIAEPSVSVPKSPHVLKGIRS